MMEVRPQSSYLVSAADVSQYLRGCKVISIRSDVCATFADVRMCSVVCVTHMMTKCTKEGTTSTSHGTTAIEIAVRHLTRRTTVHEHVLDRFFQQADVTSCSAYSLEGERASRHAQERAFLIPLHYHTDIPHSLTMQDSTPVFPRSGPDRTGTSGSTARSTTVSASDAGMGA